MTDSPSLLERIRNAEQYDRLEIIQESLAQINGQQIEQLLEMSQDAAKAGDSKMAAGIAECAILCGVVIADYAVLAKALTIRAKIHLALHENQAGIYCAIQALNCVRHKTSMQTEIRAFFVENDFEFGVALADERIASMVGPQPSIDLLNQVRAVYEKYEYRLGLGFVLWNLGDIHKDARRLEEALTCYLRAGAILGHFQMHIAELLINLSFVLVQLNQFNPAERYLNEAEQVFAGEDNELGLAAVNVSKAGLMRRKMQYRNLVRLYRQAYEIYQGHNQGKDAAFVQMQVATLFTYYRGHEEQGYALLHSAIAAFKGLSDPRLANQAAVYLAMLYYNNDATNKAKELLLPILVGDESDVPTESLWQALYIMGGIERAESNAMKAYDCYSRAINIVDSMRAQLRTEDLILEFLNLKPDFYSPLVMLAIDLGRSKESLSWVERARSRSFLHILGNARSAIQSDLDAMLLEELQELDTQIGMLEKNIASMQSPEPPDIVDRWRQNLSKEQGLRENLNRRRKIHNAELAALNSVSPINWKEIRDTLSVQSADKTIPFSQ